MSSCPTCGATVRSQAKFCGVCGSAVPSSALAPAPTTSAAGPAPTQMMPSVSQSASGLQIILNSGQTMPLFPVTTIGRDATICNCLLPDDERISRVHARIEKQGGTWMLSDLNSTHGTFLKGLPVTIPVPVNQGEMIQVGDTYFSIGVPGQVAAHPVPWAAAGPPAVAYDPQAIGGPGVNDPLALTVDPPYGGWRKWDRAPLAEGIVRYEPMRYTEKKDDLLAKGCLAVMLALIMPILAFLPFIGGNDVNVVELRLQDRKSNNMVTVRARGDMIGSVNLGDHLAVWGKDQRGLVVMRRAFNYSTGHEIRVK